MQHDEMIWQVVNHQFCSFKTTIGKAKSDKTHFCRNPYSVTGLCNRTSCPLANSKYATIREDKGRIHLFIKTVERAHSPKNLWEKILLSRNYGKALSQLDEHLAYFPKVLMHRNKQRLTKIHQYLIRMRKIELKKRAGKKAKMVGIHRKIEQREERREKKALVAAKIERNIEKELVERLAKGTYGDIYNFPEMPYQKALDAVAEQVASDESEDETESTVVYVEDLESEEELEEDDEEEIEDMEYLGNGEWGDLDDESDEEGAGHSDDDDDVEKMDDDDDDEESYASSDSEGKKKPAPKKPKTNKADNTKPAGRRGPRIEIEYEEEREDAQAVAAETGW
jgi:protein MAK16